MQRKQALALVFLLLCFFGIATVVVVRAVNQSRNSFMTGSPPIDIKNALLPQHIDLAKMHPPAPRGSDPIRFGSATSLASVVEFGDYVCDSCKDLNKTLLQVLPTFHGTVRLVWRDLPVTDVHPESMDAAIFARCAGLQGKFWEAHDLLFAYKVLNEVTYSNIETILGLKVDEMRTCRQDPTVRQAIQLDVDTARNDGVNSAPFLFIGTAAHDGAMSADDLTKELKTFLSS